MKKRKNHSFFFPEQKNGEKTVAIFAQKRYTYTWCKFVIIITTI